MNLVRPLVRRLLPYTPGEQPKVKGLIKLNTNENPYPPSPKVLAAIKAATDGRLRLYPNPTASALRSKLAKFHGCATENIIVGNGSDELLALATRCFVEPLDKPANEVVERAEHKLKLLRSHAARASVKPSSNSIVQFLAPCYSLYPVLAAIHGAYSNEVELNEDFSLPAVAALRRGGQWDSNAALTFITTPNAPSGRGYGVSDLEALCRAQKGVVVLDEAYVDFANENALSLALKYPNVIVARTFSKAYSLCFQRVGYFIGPPDLIAALHKIRDSYNVNGLGQIAAEATLNDLKYYRANFRRIIATRERISNSLQQLGFYVVPSQTNFIFAQPPKFPAQLWLEKLRARKILVRWFSYPRTRDYLRITVGSETETDTLLRAIKSIISS